MKEYKTDLMTVKKIRAGGRECVIYVNSIYNFLLSARSFGLRIVNEFPFLNAVGAIVEEGMLASLTELSCVKYVSSQSKVTALEYPLSDIVESQPPQSYPKFTGKGVCVAFLDTGVAPHIDLCIPKNKIRKFVDFDKNKKRAYDDNGHGTFVAGVCAGSGLGSGRGFFGSAPNAELVAIKIMDENGECGAFKVLEGMQWILDHKKETDIKLCCMSFGSEPLPKNDPLKMGAEVLVKNGITVVCASGNSGIGSVRSPGVSANVITVGSVGAHYKISDFTSRGICDGIVKPDFYASGENIIGLSAKGYTKMSGTSVSAPYVAGLCCRLIEQYPQISPRQIKSVLLQKAYRVGNSRILDLPT